nr:MAG TPA: hypothetical protein [Crassvirales sp.]
MIDNGTCANLLICARVGSAADACVVAYSVWGYCFYLRKGLCESLI